MLGDYFWPRVLSGKTVCSPFPLDVVHTYRYIPDVAAGLAILGCADASVYGRPCMLPCTSAGYPARAGDAARQPSPAQDQGRAAAPMDDQDRGRRGSAHAGAR